LIKKGRTSYWNTQMCQAAIFSVQLIFLSIFSVVAQVKTFNVSWIKISNSIKSFHILSVYSQVSFLCLTNLRFVSNVCLVYTSLNNICRHWWFSSVVHIGAHVFNFENLVEAHDGSGLQHRLSSMEDIGNKTFINPVRNPNSVSTIG
jgi:hypothetical protein